MERQKVAYESVLVFINVCMKETNRKRRTERERTCIHEHFEKQRERERESACLCAYMLIFRG